jgi:hypothetical protein
MEEEQDPSTKQVKGFNAGYRLQKEDPELLELIISKDDEFIKAAEAGKMQMELEQGKEVSKEQNPKKATALYPEWLKDDRLDDLDRGLDLEKDIDPEP